MTPDEFAQAIETCAVAYLMGDYATCNDKVVFLWYALGLLEEEQLTALTEYIAEEYGHLDGVCDFLDSWLVSPLRERAQARAAFEALVARWPDGLRESVEKMALSYEDEGYWFSSPSWAAEEEFESGPVRISAEIILDSGDAQAYWRERRRQGETGEYGVGMKIPDLTASSEEWASWIRRVETTVKEAPRAIANLGKHTCRACGRLLERTEDCACGDES